MKAIKTLTAMVCALAVLGMASVAHAESCCDKAKAAGKACEHKCCQAAAKEGKTCQKCNPTKKDGAK